MYDDLTEVCPLCKNAGQLYEHACDIHRKVIIHCGCFYERPRNCEYKYYDEQTFSNHPIPTIHSVRTSFKELSVEHQRKVLKQILEEHAYFSGLAGLNLFELDGNLLNEINICYEQGIEHDRNANK